MNIMKRKLFHLVALVAYATFAFYLLVFEGIIIPTLLVIPMPSFWTLSINGFEGLVPRTESGC